MITSRDLHYSLQRSAVHLSTEMASKHYVLYVLTAYGGFDAIQDEMKFLPLTYKGEVTINDLTLGHKYKKSEM